LILCCILLSSSQGSQAILLHFEYKKPLPPGGSLFWDSLISKDTGCRKRGPRALETCYKVGGVIIQGELLIRGFPLNSWFHSFSIVLEFTVLMAGNSHRIDRQWPQIGMNPNVVAYSQQGQIRTCASMGKKCHWTKFLRIENLTPFAFSPEHPFSC